MTRITDSVIEFIVLKLNLPPESESKLSPLLAIAKHKTDFPTKVASIPAFTLLLNLVKAKAEMMYEMTMSLQSSIMDGTLSSDSLEEWQELLATISESLEFLKEVVSLQQQHIILDMQASFFGSTGNGIVLISMCNSHASVACSIYTCLLYINMQIHDSRVSRL